MIVSAIPPLILSPIGWLLTDRIQFSGVFLYIAFWLQSLLATCMFYPRRRKGGNKERD